MLWLLLTACNLDDAATLPDAALPPPMTLTTSGSASAGQTFGLVADGAPASKPVTFVASTGGIAMGQGYCPPNLLGACLDILPGRGGYLIVGQANADAAGHAAWSVPLPATFPPGTRWIQAVVNDATAPALSNPIEVAFTSSCPTDPWEPNDDVATATPLTSDSAGLSVCDDVDWYHLTVAPGSTIDITASFLAADGDLDLELVDAQGLLLDGSYTLRSTEVVTWFNRGATDAEVDLLVYLVQDPTGNGVGYNLDLEQIVPAVCVDDGMEEDDDAANANLAQPGQNIGFTSCSSDSDWFAIDVGAGQRLTVTALEDRAAGDVDVALYDAAMQPLTIRADAAVWDATAPATVFAEVSLTTDDVSGGGAPYDLQVDLVNYGRCTTDALEPNDARQAPATISVGYVGGLQRCDGNEDWYTFYAQRGLDVNVTLDFLYADGDLDMVIHGPNGAPVAQGTAVGDDEVVTFTTRATGTYLVNVVLYGDSGPPIIDGVAYGISLDVQ